MKDTKGNEIPSWEELFKLEYKEEEDENYKEFVIKREDGTNCVMTKHVSTEELPKKFKNMFGWVCRYGGNEGFEWIREKLNYYSAGFPYREYGIEKVHRV